MTPSEIARGHSGKPFDFSLTNNRLEVFGGTNSASELRAFIEKLQALAAFLPEDDADAVRAIIEQESRGE